MKTIAVKSPHHASLLAAHQFQGQSNDCGPYCIAIVANALRGPSLDGGQLGQQLNGWVWRGILPKLRRIQDWATLPCGITDELRQHGLKVRWRPFSRAEYLFQSLTQGKALITIIGRWKPLWAHYMVLVEVDPVKGWGFVNPAMMQKKVYWMETEEFLQGWKRFGCQLIEADYQG
jgi:hypothetical protein